MMFLLAVISGVFAGVVAQDPCNGVCGESAVCDGTLCVAKCQTPDNACCSVGVENQTCGAVAECVCGFDSYCCNTMWDVQCVNEAEIHCGLQCKGIFNTECQEATDTDASDNLVPPGPGDVVATFYEAIRVRDVDKATSLFSPDGVYMHTEMLDAQGPLELPGLLTTISIMADGVLDAHILDINIAGNAEAVVALRSGFRDSFFLVDHKIIAVMTVRDHPDDPVPPSGTVTTIRSSTPPADMAAEIDAVKAGQGVYFGGFINNDPNAMVSAFVENQPFLMYDFNADRRTPYGCFAFPEDCSRAPYIGNKSLMLPAYTAFANGHVVVAAESRVVGIWGDMSLAFSTGRACEGAMVTPAGGPPMPNRLMMVQVKENGQWKMKNYMFTFELNGPVPVGSPVFQCLKCGVFDTECQEDN